MRERVISTLVVLVALFEWIAIHWRPWPTITAMIRPHRDIWPVIVSVLAVIAFIATWATIHLLGNRGNL